MVSAFAEGGAGKRPSGGCGECMPEKNCRVSCLRILSQKDSGHERQCVQQDDMQEVYPLLDEARTHCSEGSGLGLAIVKRIVMDHQGSIYAKNSGGLEICMEFSAS